MRFIAALLIAGTLALAGCSRTSQPKDFASAEEAAQALVAAARANDTDALLAVMGEQAKPLIDSGDPVQNENARLRFVSEYDAAHSLKETGSGSTELIVGADEWPFPIPLVQENSRWRFDSAAGAEEIINRRVGANELATIQSCLAFVDAQREYYSLNPEQDPLLHFAQKLVSSDGKKDGLYWPASAGGPSSPLGEQFAAARAEGYFKDAASQQQPQQQREPFHGYVYKLLTAQGPNAEGGAYDYMVREQMLGGFALIAFPAEYGSSGVMTFIVNHAGAVYSKDLGPETAKIAEGIKVFDPDSSWKREATIE